MMDRSAKEQKMLADFPIGTVVRVKPEEVDNYISSVANKVRERLGEVIGHQFPTPRPIVAFHAIGRRKEFKTPMSNPWSTIEIVTDEATIAAWRIKVDTVRQKAGEKAKKLVSKWRP